MKTIQFQILSSYSDIHIIQLSLNRLKSDEVSIEVVSSEHLDMNCDYVIIGIDKLEDNYIDELIKQEYIDNKKIIVFTFSENILLVSTLTRLGIKNIFILPIELQKFKVFLENSINEAKVSNKSIDSNFIIYEPFEEIIGESDPIIKLKELSYKVTENNQINSVILGETGTGKGLLAKAIHDASLRRNDPFIDINCAAIPKNLLESELFGYEKGAFTDARNQKVGLLELAADGTLFLDEIGDMELDIQAKLLRAIDNKVIRRLGGTKDIPIKARILTATNQPLKKLVGKKTFREDLYYRLNSISLNIPPLRDRGHDVILIANHFIKTLSKEYSTHPVTLENDVADFMLSYNWPGNVRELRNAIERGLLLTDGFKLILENMFVDLPENNQKIEEFDSHNFQKNSFDASLDHQVSEYVKMILKKTAGNKTKAAKILQISRPRLDRILKQL